MIKKNMEPCKNPECVYFTTYSETLEGLGALQADRRHNHDLHVCLLCNRFERFEMWTPKEAEYEGM